MLTVAAALMFAGGVAFAQDGGGAGGAEGGAGAGAGADTGGGAAGQGQPEGSGATDPGNYLTGPNINRFYSDDTMSTLRSDDEVRSNWDAMSEADRNNLRQACQGNTDARYTSLCDSVGRM
jgi:hypothetical protein